MKLRDILTKLNPEIDYKVAVDLKKLEGLGAMELEKEDIQNHLDYPVVSIEPDFTIIVRAKL